MFNNGDSVKESQYSDNSYSNNNENSIESPDQNSLIKIFDDKEEEWTFNKKINDSSKSNSIKLENKDLSNKAVLNDKNNNLMKISDIKSENKEYINLKKNIIHSNIEETNSRDNSLNDKSILKSNNTIMKKLLFTDMSNTTFKENEIDSKDKEIKNEEKVKNKIKINNNTLKEEELMRQNILKINLNPYQSDKKSKNSLHLFTYSNKENDQNIINLNDNDKISYNSFTILQSKNNSNNITLKSQNIEKEDEKENKIYYDNDINNINNKLQISSSVNLINENLINFEFKNNKNSRNNFTDFRNNINQIDKPTTNYKTESNKSYLNKSQLNNITNLSDYKSNKIWKFASEINSTNIDLINIDGSLLLEFLNEIDLLCYYNLFISKGIYSFNKVIKDMKEGKFKITKSDIEEIGIEKIGHIYRIITKLEIESEFIDRKISKELLNYTVTFTENFINSTEYCFGCNCCSYKEKNIIISNQMKFNLDIWLKKNNLYHLKNNFVLNGYDKMEYFVLQMFSSIPINEEILKNELKISCEKERDIILFQLNKDIKKILKIIYKKEYFYNKKIDNIKKEENCFLF